MATVITSIVVVCTVVCLVLRFDFRAIVLG